MLEEHVLQFRQLGIRDTLDAMTALLRRRENGESCCLIDVKTQLADLSEDTGQTSLYVS